MLYYVPVYGLKMAGQVGDYIYGTQAWSLMVLTFFWLMYECALLLWLIYAIHINKSYSTSEVSKCL